MDLTMLVYTNISLFYWKAAQKHSKTIDWISSLGVPVSLFSVLILYFVKLAQIITNEIIDISRPEVNSCARSGSL